MSRSETRLHTQTIMARVTTRRDDAILNTNNSQSSAWASKPSRSGGFWGWLHSGQVAHLRLQVVGQSDLVDELDLGSQEGEGLFRVVRDLLQQVARNVVAHGLAVGDAVLDGALRGGLEGEITAQQFGHVFAYQQLAQVLQIGQAVQEEDALHELVGVLHLADRLFVFLLRQLVQAPVFQHAVMQKVLVGGGQFVLQLGIEERDDLGVAFHVVSFFEPGAPEPGLYSKGLPETTPAQRNSTCSTRFPTPDIGLSRCLEPSWARITNGELPVLPVLPQALLALADGTVFSGSSIGATGHTVGEVVFNTSLTGYQEILTD